MFMAAMKTKDVESDPGLYFSYLAGLNRRNLQELAKDKGIKANIKSQDIIKRLLEIAQSTYRSITPVSEEKRDIIDATRDLQEEDSACPDISQKAREKPTDDSDAPHLPPSAEEDLDGRVEKQLQPSREDLILFKRIASVQNVLESHPAESRATVTSANRFVSPKSNITTQRAGSPQSSSCNNVKDNDVRDVRRCLAHWNEERINVQDTAQNMRELIRHADRQLAEGKKIVEQVMLTRMSTESRVVKRLKWDRHLYDGTWQMEEGRRGKWKEFVYENWNQEKIYIRMEKGRQRRHAEGVFSESDDEIESDEGSEQFADGDPLSDDSTADEIGEAKSD